MLRFSTVVVRWQYYLFQVIATENLFHVTIKNLFLDFCYFIQMGNIVSLGECPPVAMDIQYNTLIHHDRINIFHFLTDCFNKYKYSTTCPIKQLKLNIKHLLNL
jgi:hypothetical protein